MSKSKRKKFGSEKEIVGKDTILPTPDKSADPPQPQGKTVIGDFPDSDKHNTY